MRNDPGIRGRFEREVEIGRQLRHPGLPRLIEADTAVDWPYAVFELVPGLNIEQLRRILAENGRLLPYPVTMSLLCRALEALDAAHRLDVIHRDLSPRNLMLSFDGTVRVIDFGAAKAEVGDFKTRPGTAMRSIHYAPPEYFRGEGGNYRWSTEIELVLARALVSSNQRPGQLAASRALLGDRHRPPLRPPWELAPPTRRDPSGLAS
jgi:serine/threonine-protein kinase